MTARYAISDTLILALRASAPDPAQPGAADLLHGAADHVHAALRLRLRRRDPDPGLRQLRRLPDPRDHRPADVVRRLRHRPRPRRRPEEGPGRPLPLAADVANGRAHRPHALRHRDERARADRDGDRRLHRRLQLLDVGARGGRRDRALPADRLCVLLGVRHGRAARLDARVRERVRLHRDLPAHFRLLRVRAPGHDARLAADVRQPTSTRSRSWSTRSGRCSSVGRPATTSGARSPGASG